MSGIDTMDLRGWAADAAQYICDGDGCRWAERYSKDVPALCDAADERDALRKRVAELEAFVADARPALGWLARYPHRMDDAGWLSVIARYARRALDAARGELTDGTAAPRMPSEAELRAAFAVLPENVAVFFRWLCGRQEDV